MKQLKHKRLYIFFISAFITYFLYTSARASAIVERGNSAFGGELMLLFIPFIVVMIYENIVLQKKVNRESKQNRRAGNIHITEITDVKEV